MKDVLERDLKEATDFRDDMRSEAKDLGKEFALMQKTRLKELADTKRSLKEKQDMYASIDTYLLRSVGGSKSLTSTASSVSLDMYSQGKVNNRGSNLSVQRFKSWQSSSASTVRSISDYAEAFDQMKRAAGVNEIDEVIERFRTQGRTSEILEGQNEKAKEDVKKLSEVKEELQETWEKVR